jgi:formyltetrahydrofolate-dependent phosphoribosylglycinamide formyltransferase
MADLGAKARVGVLISGRGSNMAALLYAAQAPDCPYEIAVVISNVIDAPGLDLARAEGLRVWAQSHKGLTRAQFDALVDHELQASGCEYVALAGFMRLVSRGFAEKWHGRMVNIHPSLLPAHKGLDTHAAVLAAGETSSGCSVHLVTPELDDGPVLGQTRVAVLPGDTPETLAARVLIAEHQLYPRVLAELVRAATAPQALLARVRALALALPAVAERLSHGSPGFFVEGGKFFAYFQQNHHGDGNIALLVKASGVEEQAMLIESDPALYYRPAYFGPSGWIGIRLDGDTDWAQIADWLARSWRASAPKRLAMLPV